MGIDEQSAHLPGDLVSMPKLRVQCTASWDRQEGSVWREDRTFDQG